MVSRSGSPLSQRSTTPKIPHQESQTISAAAVDECVQPTLVDDEAASNNNNGFEAVTTATSSFLTIHRKKLYGRQHEIQVLSEAYQRSKLFSQELVLIKGPSGTGKTSLAHNLRSTVQRDGGYFLSGKFENRKDMEPYAVFVQAFNQYIDALLSLEQPSVLKRVCDAVKEAVDDDGRLITDVIPSLERIICWKETKRNKVYGFEALHRFRLAISKFLNIVASLGAPLVLFLDDLQWADVASLELLQSILLHPVTHDDESSTPSHPTSLLVILAYRDDHEIDTDNENIVTSPPFALYLQSLMSQHQDSDCCLQVSKIALSNLNPSSVNELLAGILKLAPEETSSLTQVVYRPTDGNIFHVLQYARLLVDQGFLEQDHAGRWRWDCEELESQTGLPITAEDLVKRKLEKLPTPVLEALQAAACMGNEIDDTALRFALQTNEISKRLIFAEEQSLVVFLPQFGGYHFAHDAIFQAVFSTIEDPKALHLKLGRILLKASNPVSLENNIFAVVNLFNQGSPLIVSPSERIEVAELNLLAGEKALAKAAFSEASRYLERGIELLRDWDKMHWIKKYDLSLKLHESAAEAAVYTQNFERVRELIGQVFENAKCLDDRLRSYALLLDSMGQQDNVQEATNLGIDVLAELGENFPRSASKWEIFMDFRRTNKALRGLSDQNLLNLESMTDDRKIACTQILNILFLCTYQARSPFTALIAFRSIQLCLKYGLFRHTAQAFAIYGMALCGSGLNVKEGYRFGKLAISLLDGAVAKDAKELLPRVYSIVYGGVNHWSNPLRQSLEPLQYASRVGIECGDVKFAMFCAGFRCTNSFFAGVPLAKVELELGRTLRQMRHYKQENTLLLTKLTAQLIQNLTGRAKNPTILSGEIIDFEDVLREARETNNLTVVVSAYLHATYVAYLFGDYELAGAMAAENRNLSKAPSALFGSAVLRFKEGLVAAARARSGVQRSSNMGVAKQALQKMKHWAKGSPCNFAHKAQLLEGELKSMHRGHQVQPKIVDLYDQAIAGARREGFTHEAAMACERAGDYLHHYGAIQDAISYWNRSHEFYLEWGATGKASQLQEFIDKI